MRSREMSRTTAPLLLLFATITIVNITITSKLIIYYYSYHYEHYYHLYPLPISRTTASPVDDAANVTFVQVLHVHASDAYAICTCYAYTSVTRQP